MKKYIFYFIIGIVISGALYWIANQSTSDSPLSPTATVEEINKLSEADYDIDLKGINAPDTNLKNFRNKKLFLNFWGTWCPPCRTEWPTIQALYNNKKGQLDFVLIAMQDQEENVVKFLKENKYSVPVYIAKSPIPASLLPKAFPTTLLLNTDGKIFFKEDASMDWNNKDSNDLINTFLK